jgi:uncharacterized protein
MMSLKQQLEQDLLGFMRTKDEVGRNTLRLVISSIKLAEIENKTSITDDSILGILQKEIKIRRDSSVEFEKGQRQDLVATTAKEIEIMEKYLPLQMTDVEIEQFVKQLIDELGVSSPSDMGKVMKIVIPKLTGKAPSDKVSLVVRKILSK